MSHARDVVYKSEILGVAVHSCALPEGEGCGPMGNHNTVVFLIDGWLRMGLLPPPPLGNFADISYLVEN